MKILYKQPKRKLLRFILWSVVLTVLVSIILLSSQTSTQSSQLSNKLASSTQHLYEWITQTDITPKQWDHKVRKFAHAFVFGVLACFIMLLCYAYRLTYKKAVAFTLVTSIVFAISDELHQLFVRGRGASIVDVGIDSIGIIIGMLLVSTLYWRKKQ